MSLLKTGLLQLSPESVVVGEVMYYDRCPLVRDRINRECIAEALGPSSKVFTEYHQCLAHSLTVSVCFLLVSTIRTINNHTDIY